MGQYTAHQETSDEMGIFQWEESEVERNGSTATPRSEHMITRAAQEEDKRQEQK
jgi:hypothetical protein